jgi:hypothetical protein
MRIVAIVFALLPLFSASLRAQDASVGASYTLLSLTYPDQIPNGFGGWLTWKFVDVGANVFPEDHAIVGRQTQLLAGIRRGLRAEWFGAYARVRPGLVHFSRRFLAPNIACIAIFPTPEACLVDATNFAVDLGGTVELYPARRSVVRVEIGDTLIRFDRTGQDATWKQNFQFTAGAGVRF